MSKTIIQFMLLYVILVPLQALVFNRIYLFNTAMPLAFIYIIMRLPVTLGPIGAMTLSFLTGLSVDVFSDTLGMNALACTLLAVLRLPALRLYFPREEDLSNPEPSMKSLGVGIYMKYAITVSLIYCTIFFSIESFSFYSIGRLLMRIVGSAVLTFIIIMCIDSILTNKRNK